MREVKRHADPAGNSRTESSYASSEGLGVKLELLRTHLREVHAQLVRYAVSADALAKHGLNEERFEKLGRIIDKQIDLANRAEVTRWMAFIDPYIQPLEQMLDEAKQVVQQDRLPRLEKWHLLAEIAACDAQALELLPKTFSLRERIDTRVKLEGLMTGEEVGREYLGSAGSTNAPSKRRLKTENGQSIIVYAKERLKEAAFKMDKVVDKDGDERWNIYQQVYNPTSDEFDWQVFDPRSIDDNDEYEASVRELFRQLTSESFGAAVRAHLAKEMDLSAEEVIYDNETVNARAGVLPGEMTIREWANSRLDLLLGMGTFPLTAIRPEPNGHDIASIQEEVVTQDPQRRAEKLTIKQAAQLFETPPSEWGSIFPGNDNAPGEPAKSITRAGIMAQLMGDLDGIEQNCMMDPVSKKISRIDEGLSLGLLTGKTITFEIPVNRWSAKTIEVSYSEPIRSIPLELVMHHGLTLDKEAHEYLKTLYASFQQKTGKESEYLNSIFGLTFRGQGKKVAKKQTEKFLERLKEIVDHGRPMKLRKGSDYVPSLETESLKRKAHQKPAA